MVKLKDRIELVDTTNPDLKSGQRGTVLGFQHLPTGQYLVYVLWDDGKNNPLLEGDDRFRVIT